MPIKKLFYTTLDELLVEKLSSEEWTDTIPLIKKLRIAKRRGWLEKDELIDICKWKSPRAIWHIKSNRKDTIRNVTGAAFCCRNEPAKIKELTKLKGVSIPMASAILTLTNPRRYGVIDIRVWEVLFHMGTVKTNPKGAGFKFEEWGEYLTILRYYAAALNVKARDIERTIFMVHKNNQKGLVYGSSTTIKKNM